MSHTYVVVEISPEAYEEIRAQLEDADYHHVLNDAPPLDMYGLAVAPKPPEVQVIERLHGFEEDRAENLRIVRLTKIEPLLERASSRSTSCLRPRFSRSAWNRTPRFHNQRGR